MAYDIKPLSCDPTKLKGVPEKLIVSRWENNYAGAVAFIDNTCWENVSSAHRQHAR